jgi:hypothetical protein
MIYHRDIWRRHKHIVAYYLRKLLIIFAFTGALLWILGVTLAYGTYFAAIIANDYFIIAIDSRAINLTDPSQPPNDRYCKIWPLADDLVFFTTGAVSAINNTGEFFFDAVDVARRVYTSASGRPRLRLSEEWAVRMETAYTEYYFGKKMPRFWINPNDIITGYFAGLDENDVVAASSATVSRSGSSFAHTNEYILPIDNPRFIHHNGHVNIIYEFINDGTTDRARQRLSEIKAETVGRSPVDSMALRAEAFVKAVMEWSADPYIGGEIATLIVERGKKWRWFSRPDFCP